MLRVITGPVFSGKSVELIRRLNRFKKADRKIAAFNPIIEGQYSPGILSHDGICFNSITINSISDLTDSLDMGKEIVALDSCHFFNNDIIKLVKYLNSKNKIILLSGLDMDYTGSPFGAMPYLLAIADKVHKLKAVCTKCGADAGYSQKIVSVKEKYEPRCYACFQF